MKLYTFDAAPNPARLKMFIEYKGITVDTEQIDIGQGAQRTSAYTDIVPEATLPALVIDEHTRLTEVIAIAHFLEAEFPQRPLLGTTPLERAQVLNWNHRLFNTLFMACAEAFRNSHPAYAGRGLPGPLDVEQIPALAERGKLRLNAGLQLMERELAGRPFVAGSRFSFADIDLLAVLGFAKWAAKTEPSDDMQHLQAWRQRAMEALASPG